MLVLLLPNFQWKLKQTCLPSSLDVALLYTAREACLARANRLQGGSPGGSNSQTTGAGLTGTVTLFMALYAGKKLRTKEMYFFC